MVLNYVRCLYKWEQKKVYDFIRSDGTKLLRKDLELYDSMKTEDDRLAKFKEKNFLVGNTGKIFNSMKEFNKYMSSITIIDIHENMYEDIEGCCE